MTKELSIDRKDLSFAFLVLECINYLKLHISGAVVAFREADLVFRPENFLFLYLNSRERLEYRPKIRRKLY